MKRHSWLLLPPRHVTLEDSHTDTGTHSIATLIVKQMAGIVPFSEKYYTSHNLIGQSDLNIQDKT